MSFRALIERARSRYAAPLYRLALLRDSDPTSAGRAVVHAFQHQDWSTTSLDDHLESRLVAALPPLPRFRLGRRRPLARMPVAFAKLSPNARLALGMRLLRGLSTQHIAEALILPLPEAQTLLLDSIGTLAGDTESLDAECHRCRAARLDEPAAERAHVLQCQNCQEALGRWERAEVSLATDLGHVIGTLPLPTAVEASLERLAIAGDPAPLSFWHRPWLLPTVLVAVIIVGSIAIFTWPAPKSRTQSAAQPSKATPLGLIEDARQLYAAAPPGNGIVHRQWEINLSYPPSTLIADEWIDPHNPARHRMQLRRDDHIAEWEAGDGHTDLRYFNAAPWMDCGPASARFDATGASLNYWKLSTDQQHQMQTARWTSGIWSLGRQYLDVARTAGSVRSLGLVGTGAGGALVLSAEGSTISGTLLLSFDPVHHNLTQVREVRHNNGQAEEHSAWRQTTSEVLDTTAGEDALTLVYPEQPEPSHIERGSALVDPTCPLITAEQTHALPEVLAHLDGPSLIGLPTLPTGIDRAILVDVRSPSPLRVQTIYLGTDGHRMVFSYGPEYRTRGGGDWTTVGSWLLRLYQIRPQTYLVVAQEGGTAPSTDARQTVFSVWAEGWSREELLRILAGARPLYLSDWLSATDHYWQPTAFDPWVIDALRRVAPPRPPAPFLHEVDTVTILHDPAVDAQTDPYHRAARVWPASRTVDHRTQFAPDGTISRSLTVATGPTYMPLSAAWTVGSQQQDYDAVTDTVLSSTLRFGPWSRADQAALDLVRYQWTIVHLPNGALRAERAVPVVSSAADSHNLLGKPPMTSWADEPWISADLAPTLTYRLEWDVSDHFQQSQILGRARPTAEVGKSPLRVDALTPLEQTVVDHSEWVPGASDASFDFTPPTLTTQFAHAAAGAGRQQSLAVFADRPEAVARSSSMPIWYWAGAAGQVPEFVNGRLATGNVVGHMIGRVALDRAVPEGYAVELRYLYQGQPLTMLEGWSDVMRLILAQTPPQWNRPGKLSTISVDGQPAIMYRFENTNHPDRHWAVIDSGDPGQPLAFLNYQGTSAQFDTLLRHIDSLHTLHPGN